MVVVVYVETYLKISKCLDFSDRCLKYVKQSIITFIIYLLQQIYLYVY